MGARLVNLQPVMKPLRELQESALAETRRTNKVVKNRILCEDSAGKIEPQQAAAFLASKRLLQNAVILAYLNGG